MTTKRIKRFPAVVLLIGGILAASHMAATLVFTGPQTPLKQSLQPALDRYFLGPLDQGWGFFAPGPYSLNEYVLVRACLSPIEVCAGGAEAGAEFTEWHNVTAREMDSLPYNLLASRVTRQSKAIHGRFWSAASDLEPEFEKMAEANHIMGESVFGVDLYSADATEKFTDAELHELRSYKRLEDVAVGFGSLYAYREWGGEASIVEVRMRRDPVTPFQQRHADPPPETSSNFINIGWRDVTEFEDDVLAAWR